MKESRAREGEVVSDKILFVDDEPSALEGYQRVLHRKFEVRTATSGGEGLVRIEKDGPFAVVISDMRMPGMNGAEFLARVREMAPETVRMLLTGHADLHAAIEAVNRGRILHFLTKPCEREVLVAAIHSGLDQYHATMGDKELARKARVADALGIDWEAAARQQEAFESPAGLPGSEQARAYLEPLAGRDGQVFVVVFRLPVLETVGRRYGESAATEYLRLAAGFLQQALRAGDRIFHWQREVLLAVVRRHISAEAVKMEMERLIAETRGHIIEVQGRPMMIACLITFDLVPAGQFAGAGELLAACQARAAGHGAESAGAA